MNLDIEYVDKLHPVFTKPKRIKIVVGGRGSTKSTGIADYVAAKMAQGELWCCAREQLNSIEESVHRTILDEIDRIGLPGFKDTKTSITHNSGGRCFYRGLSRNISSLKSTLSGVDGLWIEEGEDLSANTLRVLTASVRLNATDTQRAMKGEAIKMPEIIITMNRGSRNDPMSKKFLARAEKDLERCGYFEDDLLMVVELNYTDMPEEWFLLSGLEQERLDDLERMSTEEYESKWLGKYYDSVEGSIIKPEWFDAAIDAHKIERLQKVFKPSGARIASFDPSDGGDNAGYALRHGSIICKVREKTGLEIDEACDWALGQAIQDKADVFVWDGDGMGSGLKRQIADAFNGKHIKPVMFKGSLRGSGQDNAEKIYQPGSQNPTKYSDTFLNNRSQYYTTLADRFYNTFKCVVRGEYIDPDEMISIDSEGVENINALRSEICRIPSKDNPNGLIQIKNKIEMKQLGIESPGMADSVMMSMITPPTQRERKPIKYNRRGIV